MSDTVPPTPAAPADPRDRPVPFNTMFSELEIDLILSMMSATGTSTIAGVVNTALWKYAQHLDLDPPVEAFAPGAPRVRKTKKKPPAES